MVPPGGVGVTVAPICYPPKVPKSQNLPQPQLGSRRICVVDGGCPGKLEPKGKRSSRRNKISPQWSEGKLPASPSLFPALILRSSTAGEPSYQRHDIGWVAHFRRSEKTDEARASSGETDDSDSLSHFAKQEGSSTDKTDRHKHNTGKQSVAQVGAKQNLH